MGCILFLPKSMPDHPLPKSWQNYLDICMSQNNKGMIHRRSSLNYDNSLQLSHKKARGKLCEKNITDKKFTFSACLSLNTMPPECIFWVLTMLSSFMYNMICIHVLIMEIAWCCGTIVQEHPLLCMPYSCSSMVMLRVICHSK